MTGGYVDSEDLDTLLENPSKATARNCLIRQIQYWFENGIESTQFNDIPQEAINDLKVTEIAFRNNAEDGSAWVQNGGINE